MTTDMPITGAWPLSPEDAVAAEIELQALRRERTARQVAEVVDYEVSQAVADQNARRPMAAVAWLVIGLAVGLCCASTGWVALALYLGRP